MTDERYNTLMDGNPEENYVHLTKEEVELGWHFCPEWDFLLVGPGMDGELSPCTCWPSNHPVYLTRTT